jgi:peptide chain release factor 3
MTWPVGIAGQFHGVINRKENAYHRIIKQSHGSKINEVENFDLDDLLSIDGCSEHNEIKDALDEMALLETTDLEFDLNSFLKGGSTPLYCGSALTNFGVDDLLKAVINIGPHPIPKTDIKGTEIPLDSDFSAIVFKIQANMNPNHRDQVAFLRICSGKFERGQVLTHSQSGDEISTRHTSSIFGSERETVESAYPGDIIGLINAKDVSIGDTLYFKKKVTYPPIPKFAPEIFAVARVMDISKSKQYKKGLEQLQKEGVIQLFYELNGDSTIILGAVGQMQFEVVEFRLEFEFNAKIQLHYLSYAAIKKTDQDSLSSLQKLQGIKVLKTSRNELVVLFESQYRLQRLLLDKPDIHLSQFQSNL